MALSLPEVTAAGCFPFLKTLFISPSINQGWWPSLALLILDWSCYDSADQLSLNTIKVMLFLLGSSLPFALMIYDVTLVNAVLTNELIPLIQRRLINISFNLMIWSIQHPCHYNLRCRVINFKMDCVCLRSCFDYCLCSQLLLSFDSFEVLMFGVLTFGPWHHVPSLQTWYLTFSDLVQISTCPVVTCQG